MFTVTGLQNSWAPISLGVLGVGLLFYGSVLLIIEARVALAAVNHEMDFVLRQGQQLAPAELLRPRPQRGLRFRRSR